MTVVLVSFICSQNRATWKWLIKAVCSGSFFRRFGSHCPPDVLIAQVGEPPLSAPHCRPSAWNPHRLSGSRLYPPHEWKVHWAVLLGIQCARCIVISTGNNHLTAATLMKPYQKVIIQFLGISSSTPTSNTSPDMSRTSIPLAVICSSSHSRKSVWTPPVEDWSSKRWPSAQSEVIRFFIGFIIYILFNPSTGEYWENLLSLIVQKILLGHVFLIGMIFNWMFGLLKIF